MRSRGGTGRHAGLKILWPHGCTGSIPVGSTEIRARNRAKAAFRTLIFLHSHPVSNYTLKRETERKRRFEL